MSCAGAQGWNKMYTLNDKTLSSSEIKKLATFLINIQNQTQLPDINKIAAAKLLSALQLN